jgi:hypothetical protein
MKILPVKQERKWICVALILKSVSVFIVFLLQLMIDLRLSYTGGYPPVVRRISARMPGGLPADQ